MVEQHRHHVMADRRIRMAQCSPLDSLSFAPRHFINWRSLGWSLVVVMIGAGLLGLMAVGSH